MCMSRAWPTHAAVLWVALVVAHDITERKHADAEREHLIAELDAFARTVAHDLKGPVGVIRGYSSYLLDCQDNIDAIEQSSALLAIDQTSQRLNNIIDELLLLAGVRQAEVKPAPIDMGAVVSEAVERLAYMIRDYQAVISTPSSWPKVLGHGPWIEEVWVNYISNALKYGGNPPSIELGSSTCENGQVRFWVQDNGTGIPLEAQTQLFTPFTQLDRTRASGYGLGLSIVRRIAEKLGGSAGIESDTSQPGSRFYFTLPASNGSCAARHA